jgi:hypothetical protein
MSSYPERIACTSISVCEALVEMHGGNVEAYLHKL